MTLRRRQSPVGRQRGGVLLVLVMVLLVAAALAGVLAVRGTTGDLRMSGAQRVSRSSFYCAEAGLNYARPIFMNNYGQWNNILAGIAPVGFTYPVTLDIDGGGNDVTVSIIDNFDEPAGTANNAQHDNDLTVIMVATCNSATLTDATTQRKLEQIITFTGSAGTDYRFQAGHSSTHSGNEN